MTTIPPTLPGPRPALRRGELTLSPGPVGSDPPDLARLVRELEGADRHADAVYRLPGASVVTTLRSGPDEAADAWQALADAAEAAVDAAESRLAGAMFDLGLRVVTYGEAAYARRVGVRGRPITRYRPGAEVVALGERPAYRAG